MFFTDALRYQALGPFTMGMVTRGVPRTWSHVAPFTVPQGHGHTWRPVGHGHTWRPSRRATPRQAFNSTLAAGLGFNVGRFVFERLGGLGLVPRSPVYGLAVGTDLYTLVWGLTSGASYSNDLAALG